MLNILVIDDDAALLEALRAYLTHTADVHVQTIQTSREALDLLSNSQYDAIVLDYDMPEIDGLEILKIIRSRGDTTPVILFTGVGREHTAIEALNLGADFFIKKGENPEAMLQTVLERIEQAVDGKIGGRLIGAAQKMLTDVINFSSDPGFAIDSGGKVIAWNDAMEQLTGTRKSTIICQGDLGYSELFFDSKRKMLINMVFDTDEQIQKAGYLLVSRIKHGPVIAVTKGTKPDGKAWTLWMKAMALYDVRGHFIASVGTVRDITSTVKDLPITEVVTPAEKPVQEIPPAPKTGIFDRILGKAPSAFKEGVYLYARELKYREAIAAFDRAITADPNLAYVWNYRGLCYRDVGDYNEAIKSFLRAVELEPENLEVLYDLGETLEMIGVMQRENKYFDAAIQMFKIVINKLPNNESAWNHIGICLKEMGKPEESRLFFDRARDVKLWKKDTPVPRKRDEVL